MDVISVGVLGSVCLDETCESLVSASATWAMGNGSVSALIYGGSLVAKLSEHAKLVLEVVTAAGGADFEQAPGALLNYGVRFHSHNFAGDVGLVRPVGHNVGAFVLGLPFVSFSYRTS